MTSPRSITLFVPGPWADEARARAVLAKHGLEEGIEWIANDGHFAEAFSFGRFSASEIPALDACPGAVVVTTELEQGREGEQLLALGRALHGAGGLGVRVEESKAAWAFEPWLAHLSTGDPSKLFRAVVVALSDAETQVTSMIGMHVFGLPDAQVSGLELKAADYLLTTLCVYQLAEQPTLASGHTFLPDAETPRVVLERWPDDRYPAAHPCHNPFGVWRLVPPSRSSRKATEHAIVPVPALVAVLMAAEKKAGRPLSKKEVEAITEKAACIAMSHVDARELELTRGYADLDPERAWAQWQIARATHEE